MRRSAFPALAGLLAVASGAAVARAGGGAARPPAGRHGGRRRRRVLVDAAPTPVKEFAVATLGTADKPVLLGGIAVVLAVLAAALGVVAFRNRGAGLAGAAVLGLVGAAAALTRPAAELVDALPSLVGGLVIAGALVLLLRARAPLAVARTRPWPTATPRPRLRRRQRGPTTASRTSARASPCDRRAFLGAAALVAARRRGRRGSRRRCSAGPPPAPRAREAVRLPAPAEPAPPLPAGVEPGLRDRQPPTSTASTPP